MKRILKGITIMSLLLMLLVPSKIMAIDDGAYLAGRTTSYANPLTGQTEDGGTNIALGDSMANSLVPSQLLVEQTNGKIYVTFGIGLASNISNYSFKLMNSSGQFSSVSATQTGSSSANGDTVKHFRVQVNSLSDYISPVVYVDPMGRNVQFFIKLDTGSLTPGTGIYKSEMIPATTNESTTTSQNTNTTEETNEATTNEEAVAPEPEVVENANVVGEINRETLFEGVSGLSAHVMDSDGQEDEELELTVTNLKNNKETSQDKKSNNLPLIVGVIVVVGVLVVAGGVYYVKKIKK